MAVFAGIVIRVPKMNGWTGHVPDTVRGFCLGASIALLASRSRSTIDDDDLLDAHVTYIPAASHGGTATYCLLYTFGVPAFLPNCSTAFVPHGSKSWGSEVAQNLPERIYSPLLAHGCSIGSSSRSPC